MATSKTAAPTALVSILAVLVALLVKIAVSRGPSGRGWGRAHTEAWEGGLVAPVGGLVGSSHRDTQLLLGHLGELEGVELRRHACHRRSALHRRRVGHLSQLLRLQEAHVNILLMCSCNLLLLLLEQLDLLLYG